MQKYVAEKQNNRKGRINNGKDVLKMFLKIIIKND
jgi:hypothetical protein